MQYETCSLLIGFQTSAAAAAAATSFLVKSQSRPLVFRFATKLCRSFAVCFVLFFRFCFLYFLLLLFYFILFFRLLPQTKTTIINNLSSAHDARKVNTELTLIGLVYVLHLHLLTRKYCNKIIYCCALKYLYY